VILTSVTITRLEKAATDNGFDLDLGWAADWLHFGSCQTSMRRGRRAVRSEIAALHRLMRRAFQLSRTLPDELLHVFEAETANLSRSTEAERLMVQRVGQDIFRRGLEYWDGRCAITGLAVPDLLWASHIKPWADCEREAERLDIWNGLLLGPHLDAAFRR
jgi:putative restriction endonuclease